MMRRQKKRVSDRLLSLLLLAIALHSAGMSSLSTTPGKSDVCSGCRHGNAAQHAAVTQKTP
jgi:hypothetical protein